jgi:glycosyltransferase involved in cell wall biosynthesis
MSDLPVQHETKVCILLSIYNGEEFLAEQLNSIARQSGVSVHILARDDGSQDNSAAVLKRACEANGISYRLMTGGNIGASRSFLSLLYEAERSFDCYAFCDQDDVWLEKKLDRAARQLAPHQDRPALYISRQFLTDSRLSIRGLSDLPRRIGFGNALVQNVATGCASVFNLQALKLLQSMPMPSGQTMHDHWAYKIVSSAGSVIYDREPTVLYRQHGRNLVGYESGAVAKWKKRLRNHLARDGSDRTDELIELSGPFLGAQDLELARRLRSSRSCLPDRLRLAFSSDVWRQGPLEDLVMRGLILLGKCG